MTDTDHCTCGHWLTLHRPDDDGRRVCRAFHRGRMCGCVLDEKEPE